MPLYLFISIIAYAKVEGNIQAAKMMKHASRHWQWAT